MKLEIVCTIKVKIKIKSLQQICWYFWHGVGMNINFTWDNSWYGTLDSPRRHLIWEEQVTEPLIFNVTRAIKTEWFSLKCWKVVI